MDVHHHGVFGRGRQNTKDLVVAEPEIVDRREQLEARKALRDETRDLRENVPGSQVRDDDVEPVVDMALPFGLGDLSLNGVMEAFASALEREVHEARDAASGGRPAAALVVIRGCPATD